MSDSTSAPIPPLELEGVSASEPRTEATRFVPGEPDMWAFVLFEALIFTGYFTIYMVSRARSPDLFASSQQHLDLRVGVFNTLVLLISSWLVACCVRAARDGSLAAARRHIRLAALFGVVFLVAKTLEWRTEVCNGFTFTTDEFSSYYYFLTGIHFLHLFIGFGALSIAWRALSAPKPGSQRTIETCATYWHTVDFLWIMIFSLLYVMR